MEKLLVKRTPDLVSTFAVVVLSVISWYIQWYYESTTQYVYMMSTNNSLIHLSQDKMTKRLQNDVFKLIYLNKN